MKRILFAIILAMPIFSFAQTPPIEPGVSLELAKWRTAHYSDVRYKLNLTLEKMSPLLKGTIEIRVKLSEPPASAGGQTLKLSEPPASAGGQTLGSGAETRPVGSVPQIILDWRKLKGYEERSTITNVSVNGRAAAAQNHPVAEAATPLLGKEGSYQEQAEHLIFRDGVIAGENIIKLDFTSPILTSGSAITRYVDKEDGSEYIYSLFVPSDASTAFPVFDQPDMKARFKLNVSIPRDWTAVSNSRRTSEELEEHWEVDPKAPANANSVALLNWWTIELGYAETKPISTYVFAFAAGPWEKVLAAQSVPPALAGGKDVADGGAGSTFGSVANTAGHPVSIGAVPPANAGGTDKTAELSTTIYVRKSQAAKFKPHAAEVFRLNRDAVKYFERYFDYKFPFPKYDLVLIPEFPFGGMEHAGATFLRESSIIFPQEPTKNDYISRATLIFHETAHQWFGDTVTMRWFDDLWLKEGFATFMAYKALEKIMPEMNAWKVFYERVKQGAYATDSTKGTTAIYQPIANLSAAKSAYGNIVYNKAPAFLRQAEFYLGEDKFQTAVRAFLKKHEFGNAGWEDLVNEFQNVAIDALKQNKSFPEDKKQAEGQRLRDDIKNWATIWVNQSGLPIVKATETDLFVDSRLESYKYRTCCMFTQLLDGKIAWPMSLKTLVRLADENDKVSDEAFATDRNSGAFFTNALGSLSPERARTAAPPLLVFPNYGDYGYGIFLLDEKSRDYVLKNIQNERDPFLRSMPKLLAELEKTETSDDAKRYAYAAKAGIATAENKAKYWNDFINNKQISESWVEAAMGPWNSIRQSELTLPYLEKALQELPNHKRSRKIFFVNGWLGACIGGQRSEEALAIVNKFLADNPTLDNDLRLKVLENVDLIERSVKIRSKFKTQ